MEDSKRVGLGAIVRYLLRLVRVLCSARSLLTTNRTKADVDCTQAMYSITHTNKLEYPHYRGAIDSHSKLWPLTVVNQNQNPYPRERM